MIPAPSRTGTGYRTYDERAVERLQFIARAKQLGCTLDEISGLTAAWDADECGPVKERLRWVVADKIADLEARMRDMAAFVDDLRSSADALADDPVSGPCDQTCGCTTSLEAPSGRSFPVAFLGRAVGA